MDQLQREAKEVAAKIIFQTTDGNIAAKNVLTDLEVGQIVTTARETSLNRVDNSATSFAQFQALAADWDKQAERVSSTFDAITGEAMPSGTPFRRGSTDRHRAHVYRQEARRFRGICQWRFG